MYDWITGEPARMKLQYGGPAEEGHYLPESARQGSVYWAVDRLLGSRESTELSSLDACITLEHLREEMPDVDFSEVTPRQVVDMLSNDHEARPFISGVEHAIMPVGTNDLRDNFEFQKEKKAAVMQQAFRNGFGLVSTDYDTFDVVRYESAVDDIVETFDTTEKHTSFRSCGDRDTLALMYDRLEGRQDPMPGMMPVNLRAVRVAEAMLENGDGSIGFEQSLNAGIHPVVTYEKYMRIDKGELNDSDIRFKLAALGGDLKTTTQMFGGDEVDMADISEVMGSSVENWCDEQGYSAETRDRAFDQKLDLLLGTRSAVSAYEFMSKWSFDPNLNEVMSRAIAEQEAANEARLGRGKSHSAEQDGTVMVQEPYATMGVGDGEPTETVDFV